MEAAIAPATLLRRTRSLAPVFVALAAGCAGEPPPPCPPAGILGAARQATAYVTPGERRADAIRYNAAVADLASSCSFTDGGVAVELQIALNVVKGPAYEGPARVAYFVAVIGPGEAVLSRQRFTSTLALPPDWPAARTVETVVQRIPAAPADAAGYRLAVGLALDRDEAERRLEERRGG